MQIYYSRNNKKLKTSVSNSDMKVFSTHHHARHVVKIKAKKDLTLLKADHKIAFYVNHKDKYFLKINALFGSVLMTSDDIATYDDKKKEILEEALRLFKNGKVINVNRLNKKKIAIEYELDGESRHMVYNTKKGVLHE